ncbi:MAG: hypothetical protein ACE5GC_06865, partial [Acidimicrobiia bacterium]
IEGRWLEGSSELSIASGDGVVDYLITGTGQWTRLPDGEWQELDGEPPLNNPLTALSAPTSLRSTDDAAGSVGLVAIYPAEVLGLSGAPVEVLLTIRDAVLTQARYRAIVEGVSVETVTVFAPLENTSPITAPPEVTG